MNLNQRIRDPLKFKMVQTNDFVNWILSIPFQTCLNKFYSQYPFYKCLQHQSLPIASISSDTVLQRHQERVHILEPFEFWLVNFLDYPRIVGGKMHRLVGEFGWEIGQISVRIETGLIGRRHLLLFQQVPIDALEELVPWKCEIKNAMHYGLYC